MGRWAQPLRSRDQIILFAPTLDDAIAEDHPVRLFDEVIGQLDFKDWEQQYFLVDGQPPIHPRVMASVILYGLSLGIRPSRKLEDSCGNRIDFIWLTQGRVMDHSTLAGFRMKFEKQLKGMFRQIGRVAIGLGMANLNQVGLDGTVKRSSNSRSAVAKRATLEEKLAALDQQVDQLMAQAKEADRKDDELFGESSPMKLPKALKDLKNRQKQLAAALKKARTIEAKQKQATGKSSKQGPAVPTTDPDSTLMKNKTGGFAPNYLVVLATEGKNGLIMDYQVPASEDEPSTVIPAMQHLQEAYGSDQPAAPHVVKELLADTNFNSGMNLQQLKDAGIQPWMPARKPATPQPQAVGAASIALATQPLAQNKTLDKSAFTYDPQADVYTCPQGRTLPYFRTSSERRGGGSVSYRDYKSKDCGGCPLANQCLSGKSTARSIRRDQHEPLREEMAARMKAPEGKARYRRRSFLAETPFAVMNTTMNFRQLLHRGINKVTTEIGWVCSACNLKKITNLLAIQRRQEALA